MWWRRAVGVGLPLAVFVLFLPAVHGGWLSLDDDAYVLTNPLVQNGLAPTGGAAAALRRPGRPDRELRAGAGARARYAVAAFDLGVAHAAVGRPADAMANYRRAIAIDPALAQAHNNLGVVLLEQGARDEALGHFATALRLEPGLRSARRNFIRELAAQGVPADAIAEYVRVATRAGTAAPRP